MSKSDKNIFYANINRIKSPIHPMPMGQIIYAHISKTNFGNFEKPFHFCLNTLDFNYSTKRYKLQIGTSKKRNNRLKFNLKNDLILQEKLFKYLIDDKLTYFVKEITLSATELTDFKHVKNTGKLKEESIKVLQNYKFL